MAAVDALGHERYRCQTVSRKERERSGLPSRTTLEKQKVSDLKEVCEHFSVVATCDGIW